MRFTEGLISLALCVFCASGVVADECSVPSVPHPTIQTAVNDAACTKIGLAARVFAESVAIPRSLLMQGDSSTTTVVLGQVTVTGAATEVTLQDLRVDGCGSFFVALDVAGGAQVTSSQDVVVFNAPGGACVIFEDGFESGNTSTWFGTVP